MAKFRISFDECEHDGDMQNYIADINMAGGKVLQYHVDHDEETGSALVEAENYADFKARFQETDAYVFSNFS
jgi:hypothetical protein